MIEVPPEPEDIKKYILNVRSHLGNEVGIDWDSLAVWAGNRIPSYLWKKWKFELSRRGFTWPQFIKLISYLTRDMILWMNGTQPWETFIQKAIEDLDGPMGELVRIQT